MCSINIYPILYGFIFLGSIIDCLVPVFCGDVPNTEVNALEAIYTATNGIDWDWKNISEYGAEWNFTGVSINPCVAPVWQGISCNVNCTLDSVTSCHILEISLDEYNLVGTIPDDIADIDQLQVLKVSHNSITNTIPSIIGNLLNLTELNLYHNSFYGSLPVDLSNLKNLTILDVGGNKITGAIPTDLGLLTNLIAFMVNKNDLLGTMPSEIGYLSQLKVLLMDRNDFYGMVPSTYTNLRSLEALDISHTELTGPYNIEFGPDLVYLFIGDNHISGTFPEQICTCTKLVHLSIDDLLLVGTIPTCIGSFLKMTYLHTSENLLTGTLPTQVGLLSSMVTARLSYMLLEGPIDKVFTTYLPDLQTLELSNNQFSGTFPSAIFSPKLETFSASQNCFVDEISDHICDAMALETLDLSGLTAGIGCKQNARLLGLFSVTMAPNVKGTIPSCIFSMPNLTQVSMSGNGIRSPLYEVNSPQLRILEMSNNRLLGTIPISLQQKYDLLKLDLAFNHLDGTIENMLNYSGILNSNSHSEEESTLVAVESNRLSGKIPSQFLETDADIKIIAGNLFECPGDKLPENDPDKDHYVCASEELDDTLICFGVFCACFMIAGATKHIYGYKQIPKNNNRDQQVNHLDIFILKPLYRCFMWDYDSRTGNESLDQLSFSFWKFRRFCLFVTGFVVLVLLPVIVVIKFVDAQKYSSHTFQYSWVISLAFVTKDTAAIVIASMWIGLIFVAIAFEYFTSYTREDGKFLWEIVYSRISGGGRKRAKRGLKLFQPEPESESNSSKSHWKILGLEWSDLDIHRWKVFFVKFFLILANFVVVLAVNGLYVYVVLTQEILFQDLAFIMTVLFKLLWNPMCVLPITSDLLLGDNVTQAIVVFNNILAPIIATVFVDINCLQVIFVPPDEVTLEFFYKECTLVQFSQCIRYSYKKVTDSFVPPWFYSEQCYSSVLVHYIPVYTVLYGVMEFFTPVAQLFALWYFSESIGSNERIHMRAVRRGSSVHTLATLKSGWMGVLTSGVVTPMVLPIDGLDDLKEQHNSLLRLNELRDLRSTLCLELKAASEAVSGIGPGDLDSDMDLTEQDVLSPEKVVSTVFTGRLVNVPSFYQVKEKCHNSVVILTVLLTYGVAFPPLACICALNIVVTTLAVQIFILYHYQQFKLRMESSNKRVAQTARECYLVWSDILANEIQGSHRILFENRTFLYLISTFTLLLFVYDTTMGDDYVYVALVCIVVGVYLMRVCVIVLRRIYPPIICDDDYMKIQYAESVKINVNTVNNPILRPSELGVELTTY